MNKMNPNFNYSLEVYRKLENCKSENSKTYTDQARIILKKGWFSDLKNIEINGYVELTSTGS